jgi:hypothetical protein
MSSLFDYLSKCSKKKLNKQTEAELKAERDAGPGRKISVWGQNKSTGHAARQNAGRLGEQGLQPRASAAPNKAHNNPNHRQSERKLCAKPTKRVERRMGVIIENIDATREIAKSNQLAPTPPPPVAPATQKPKQICIYGGIILRFLDLETEETPKEMAVYKTPGVATTTPQQMVEGDWARSRYVREAYGKVDYKK